MLGEGLPADPPEFWRVRSGPVSLTLGPVLVGPESMPGCSWVGPDDFRECSGPADVVGETARVASHRGEGLIVSFPDASTALEQLPACLDAANLAGLDPEQIAVDPGWGRVGHDPDLARFRAFGRPTVCSVDDPVLAAMAWDRGVRLFRTTVPAAILRALTTADTFGA